MVASYLDPSLVPAGAMPVQLPAGAGFRSSFTEHARKLVLSFPVSPWHPHRDWLDLKQAHKQTVEELEEQVALGEQRAKERDEAIVLANVREEARMGLSDECLRMSTEIHVLNKTLEKHRAVTEAISAKLEKQLFRWRIASLAAMVVSIVLAAWLLSELRPKIFTDDSSGAASASTNAASTSSDSSEGVRSSPSGADQRRGNATTPPRDADSRPGAGR
jgi:hypothetical protein